MKDLLIKDVTIVTVNETNTIIQDGAIVVDKGKIEYVGEREELAFGEYKKTLSYPGHVVIPGLVNAHTHTPMSLMRGYADDLPLQKWLFEKIFPVEDKLKRDDIYAGAMLSCVEMIRSGTTSFADMYFQMDKVAEAVKLTGMRASLSVGISSSNPDIDVALKNVEDFCLKWDHQASGRITTMLGPHAPYTCKPELLKKLAEMSKNLGVGVHIHLSETQKEVEDIKKEYNLSPVRMVESTGIFENHTLAAHCVALSEEDMEILKSYEVKLVHNPASNMKLASGISPVVGLREKGIVVGLGTDSPTSNNNLDMFQELRLASFLQKVSRLDALALPATESLRLATIESAKCLGLDNVIGSLEEGKRADIVIMNFDAVHLLPCTDVVSNIVYAASGSDVCTVIVDGEIVMEDRKLKLVDENEVIIEFKKAVKRLLG